MEAIVLAGGFGTRLKAVVPDLPKPMASVAGRPFLEILLNFLSNKGFTRVILSLGYMAEKIQNHFGEKYLNMDLIYEIETTPLGTGGAIRASIDHCLSDHVYVFNGDTYLDLDVDQLEEKWGKERNTIIVVREVPDAARFGRVNILDGKVEGFLEKGLSGVGLINAGCYVFPREVLNSFSKNQPFSIETDFFIKKLDELGFDGFVSNGMFIDIGVPEDYERAQTLLADI